MSRLRTMQVFVNGAVLGRLVVIPAYLDQTHAQNQKDVLAIDNLLPQPPNSSQPFLTHPKTNYSA